MYTAGIDIETNHNEGTGALGCFARYVGPNRPIELEGNAVIKNHDPVLLSCSHVLFPGFQIKPKLGVYQPDYSSCCSCGDRIATPVYNPKQVVVDKDEDVKKFYGGFDGPVLAKVAAMMTQVPGKAWKTDCAVAVLDPQVKFRNVWQFEKEIWNEFTHQMTKEIPIRGAVKPLNGEDPSPEVGLGVVKGPPMGEGNQFGNPPATNQYVQVRSPDGTLRYGTLFSVPSADVEHFDDPDRLLYRWGIEDTKDAKMGTLRSVEQFLILPRPTPDQGGYPNGSQDYEKAYNKAEQTGEKLTFDDGDSGSVVLNSAGLVIGLIIRKGDLERMHIARTTMELAAIGYLGIATPIQAVLKLLQIEIPAAPSGWSNTNPTAGPLTRVFMSGLPEDPELLARRRDVERLSTRLRESRRGRLLLGKIAEHRREVRRLFTNVRAISSAWHELGGAAFFYHCVRSAREPDHVIPRSINGVTRERLANTLLPLLDRHGSPGLRRDLRRHWEWLSSSLLQISTLEDVPEMITQHRDRS